MFVDGAVAIAPNGINEVANSHTFMVTVTKDAGDGSGDPEPSDGDSAIRNPIELDDIDRLHWMPARILVGLTHLPEFISSCNLSFKLRSNLVSYR